MSNEKKDTFVRRQIPSIRERSCLEQYLGKSKGFLATTTSANFQICFRNSDEKIQSIESALEQRALEPVLDKGTYYFDIATVLPIVDANEIRDASLRIIKQFLYNQQIAYSGLIQGMKSKGLLPEDASDEISMSMIADFINTKTG